MNKYELVELFADGADIEQIKTLASFDWIKGFTTNPTLMRKAGVDNYLDFALETLSVIGDRPLSLEVFATEFADMERQAGVLAELGANVNVKIPITNTKGEFCGETVRNLLSKGVAVNVTAIMTCDQLDRLCEFLVPGPGVFISVFAGRIADTGVDPIPTITRAVEICGERANTKVIWASPRELLNVVQAAGSGCHILTATPDILNKIELIGKDLAEFSLETVKMFENDALAASYKV